MNKSLLFVGAALLALTSCSGNQTTQEAPASAATATPTTETSAPAPAEATGKSTIHLVVTGGKHAGTYDISVDEVGASYGIAGKQVFGNQYSEMDKKPNELSSVQLLVNDVTGDKTTNKGFMASVGFGDMLKPALYTIDTNGKDSAGELTLDYDGGKGPAKTHVVGKTADGVTIDLTINAAHVTTNG